MTGTMFPPGLLVRFNKPRRAGSVVRNGREYERYETDSTTKTIGRICARFINGRISAGPDGWDVPNEPGPTRAPDGKYMIEYRESQSTAATVAFIHETELEIAI